MEPLEINIPLKSSVFPPNHSQLKIKRTTLFIAPEGGNSKEVNVLLKFMPDGSTAQMDGGVIRSQEGLISKLKGNGDGWDIFMNKVPYGIWNLKLRDENDVNSFSEVKQLLKDQKIKDILLMITYQGKAPAWNI
ncbi:MAG: hypothetical protein F6K42_36600 [Leptolyngbya sp. SIO1D8]|nr:hypothetical protein [Leptolyngbya sp. SIO1D8]